MTRRRILAALLVAGGLAAWGLLRPSALDRARAELDRTDSGWRLDAIWAARTADRPPEPHALAAALKALPLPAEFTAWRKATFDDPARATDRRSPGERWPADPERVSAWQASAAQVAVARRAAGRPPAVTVTLQPDVFGILLQHVQDARAVSELLAVDAIESARRGDVAGAAHSLRAVLSIGRGVDAEPWFPCALVRRWLARQAADALLRGLAVGEWPDAELASFQTELAAEADPAQVPDALRNDRAVVDQQLTALARWQTDVTSTLAGSGAKVRSLGPIDRASYRLTVSGDHRRALEEFNHLIAATRRPAHEWQSAVAAVPPPPDDGRYPVSHQAGTQARNALVGQAVSHLAVLRAAVLAVGCERFRLKHGRWPDTLSDLIPEFAPADTTDPHSGLPLRLLRLPDGLAVYSVGPDGADDGGALGPVLRTTEVRAGHDLGFRLWDIAARSRQAAQP